MLVGMRSREFTVEICEALYACPKRLASKLIWQPNKGDGFIVQGTAIADDGTMFDLCGYWSSLKSHKRTRWGFSLRYYGYVIRSYDMARTHKNPGEAGRIKGPHKHRFKSAKIPRYAYKPDPPISDEDPNQSLMDFLAEANIALPKDYQNLMFPQ
jgi:hypothetical protein